MAEASVTRDKQGLTMKQETMTYLEQAISEEGKKQRIHYHAVDHTERYADPEEKVRAEYWAEMI